MPKLTVDRATTLLAVAADAAPTLLRRAYRAAARRLHPDTLGRPATPAEVAAMAEVNAAYALLRSRPRPKPEAARPGVRPPDHVIDMRAHLNARPRPGPLRPIAGARPVEPPARVARVPRPVVIRPRPAPPPVEIRREPVARISADPAATRFDFGRYEGWSVAEIEARDPGYCDWALRHARSPKLRAALRSVVEGRPGSGAS